MTLTPPDYLHHSVCTCRQDSGSGAFNNDDFQGSEARETTTNTLVCTEKGDWTEYQVAFGEPYQFEYEFNTGFVPDANESGSTANWSACWSHAGHALDGESR